MDLLYRVAVARPFHNTLQDALAELGGIADQEGGRWAVIACGSFSRLGGLIAATRL